MDTKNLSLIDDHKKNEALTQARILIKKVGEQLGYSQDLQDQAARLFEDSLEMEKLQGKKMEAVVSACIYCMALRAFPPGKSTRMREICAVTLARKGQARRYIDVLLERSARSKSIEWLVLPTSLSKMFGSLDLPSETLLVAADILKKSDRMKIGMSCDTTYILGAALYMTLQTMGINISTADISLALKQRERSIQKGYHFLYPRAADFFPEDFHFVIQPDHLPPPTLSDIPNFINIPLHTMSIIILPQFTPNSIFIQFPDFQNCQIVICEKNTKYCNDMLDSLSADLQEPKIVSLSVSPSILLFIITHVLSKFQLVDYHNIPPNSYLPEKFKCYLHEK